MAGYSHYPKALRPKSKKVKEKQRAQRQRVRSDARQAAARKKSKAEDKWSNVKQAVEDVRTSDALALGAMAFGGRGGPKTPKTPKGSSIYTEKANLKRMAALEERLAKLNAIKPDQKITKGSIGKADKSTPKTDYSTRNIPKPKRQKKSKKKLEAEKAKRENWTLDDWDAAYGHDPKPGAVYNSPAHKPKK